MSLMVKLIVKVSVSRSAAGQGAEDGGSESSDYIDPATLRKVNANPECT